MESLSELAEQFSRERGLSEDCRGWIMVEMHNAVWCPLIAAIPPEKRLLFLLYFVIIENNEKLQKRSEKICLRLK